MKVKKNQFFIVNINVNNDDNDDDDGNSYKNIRFAGNSTSDIKEVKSQ